MALGILYDFPSAHLIEGFDHLGDDVGAVQDMQRVRAFFVGYVQAGFPHGTDKVNLRSELISDDGEEAED